MELNLRQRSVLITGGSKGIGLAVARGFAAEGCDLHLVSRDAGNLEAARDSILSNHNVAVTVHAIDLSDSDNLQQLRAGCPQPDILVNNAGAIPGGDLSSVDEATWRDAWDLKVFGYINIMREYYQRMCTRGHGVIVNVIGLAGERPDARYVAGSAGNASLMAVTRALGSVSLDEGVRVLGVNPGPVSTERVVTLFKTRAQEEHGDESRWREYFERLPPGRPASPEELADLVVYLASGRASYISGTVVTLDGGQSGRGAA